VFVPLIFVLHFVFKCACFLYHIDCYRGVTATVQPVPIPTNTAVFHVQCIPITAVIPWLPQYYRCPHPHAARKLCPIQHTCKLYLSPPAYSKYPYTCFCMQSYSLF